MSDNNQPVLDIRAVSGGYGDINILEDVDLKVHAGEVVVIVGPNGAGKSTLMKAAFGLVQVNAGEVLLSGEKITNISPDRLVHKGMSYVPQERNVFPTMSVQENLELGAYIRKDDARAQMDRIFDLFPKLKERRKQAAGLMSGGERQMVAMGRALMIEPTLLMLDEPTAGLAPAYVHQVFDWIRAINDQGVSILMVEQNAKQALRIANRGYVLATGRNRHEDTGERLLADPEIADMFLGGR
ncbi:MAG: ABC transporter ATP-binding protein [Salinisphaera sp.]|jgi:branched-chain amino acid transport system ATP-binding protein|nr:ABC transporter ATP-binding protein [Salinisphaera sp.]